MFARTQVSRDELEVMLDVLTPGNTDAVGVIPADISKRFDERLNRFIETGLLSRDLIRLEPVLDRLVKLSEDLIRTSKFVGQINLAMGRGRPAELFMSMRIVAPVDGGFDDPWMNLRELADRAQQHHRREAELATRLQTIQAAGGVGAEAVQAELSDVREQISWHEQIVDQWRTLMNGWNELDADAVNKAAARLAALLPAVNPDVYPSAQKLSWETLYFKLKNLTWIWIIYALGMVPLLMSVSV